MKKIRENEEMKSPHCISLDLKNSAHWKDISTSGKLKRKMKAKTLWQSLNPS